MESVVSKRTQVVNISDCLSDSVLQVVCDRLTVWAEEWQL